METQEYAPVLIRMMKHSDLASAADLEKLSFSEPWSLRLLEEGLSSPWDTYWVAEEQGHIIGYANLRVLAGEGEIQRIAVHPEYRRRGIGKKLMEEMTSFATKQGVGDITLEVRAGNQAAICLYKSYGFSEEGIRKRYYHNPEEDAVIMWRRRP